MNFNEKQDYEKRKVEKSKITSWTRKLEILEVIYSFQ